MHSVCRRWLTLALLLAARGLIAADESPPSVYTHFYLFPREQALSGRTPDPADAVASIDVIRPIERFDNPAPLLSSRWKGNRDTASQKRVFFRALAESEYRHHGVLKGELHPAVVRDLDTLVKRKSAIIAISDPKDPNKLFQMISVAYDQPELGGVPLEVRLIGPNFSGLPREPHRFQPSGLRFMENWGSLREVRLYSEIMSQRPAVEGEPVEIKTFIRGYKNHEDWVPTILRMMISLELIRNGVTPLTESEKLLRPTNFDIPDSVIEHSRSGVTKEEIRYYLGEQSKQRTVRIDKIFIEVIGEKLMRLYTTEHGFKLSPWSFPDPNFPEQIVFVLEALRSEFEDHVLDALKDRKGNQFLADYGQVPMAVSSGPEGNCLLDYSQLGRHLPAVLGTRGAILDGGGAMFGSAPIN
jgi:hypothetical protein